MLIKYKYIYIIIGFKAKEGLADDFPFPWAGQMFGFWMATFAIQLVGMGYIRS